MRPNFAGGATVVVPLDPGPAHRNEQFSAVQHATATNTANFFLSGADLADARAVEVTLREDTGRVLSGWMRLPFDPPLRLGVNFVVVIPSSSHWASGVVGSCEFTTVENYQLPFLRKAMPFSEVRVVSEETFVSALTRTVLIFDPAPHWVHRRAHCSDQLSRIHDAFGGSRAPARLDSSDPHWTVTLANFADTELPADECNGIAYVGDPNDEGTRQGGVALAERGGDLAGHEIGHTFRWYSSGFRCCNS